MHKFKYISWALILYSKIPFNYLFSMLLDNSLDYGKRIQRRYFMMPKPSNIVIDLNGRPTNLYKYNIRNNIQHIPSKLNLLTFWNVFISKTCRWFERVEKQWWHVCLSFTRAPACEILHTIWHAFLSYKFVNAFTPCRDGFGTLDDAKYAFCR